MRRSTRCWSPGRHGNPGTSEVTYLDLATTFNSAADVFYDGVHPNGTGEQIEAGAIFGALVDLTPCSITFINVDGTVTTQTVEENEVATPPTGVSTVDKTFTSWPTIAPASADATYTALYTVDAGGRCHLGRRRCRCPVDHGQLGDALPSNGQTVAISNSDTVEIPTTTGI